MTSSSEPMIPGSQFTSSRSAEVHEAPEVERQLRKLLAGIRVGGALPVAFELKMLEPYSLEALIKVEMVVPDIRHEDERALSISVQRSIPILTYVGIGDGVVQIGVTALHESLRALASWMYEHELKEQFRVAMPNGAERRPFEPVEEHAR